MRQPIALAFLCLGLALPSSAAAAPPRPPGYATDNAGVMDAARLSALNERLAQFERDTSNQVLVFVDRRLPADETVETFANAAFNAWQVGQKGKDNGVVFFAFVDDRKMRIEVGYGLEGAIPDARTAAIIQDVVAPRFRSSDYTGGVEQAAEELMKAARGEPSAGTGATVAEGGVPSGPMPLLFWLVPGLALAGGIVAARGGDTTAARWKRGGLTGGILLAVLSIVSGPVLQDIRGMVLGFGFLLLAMGVSVAWMIGQGNTHTGRRRVGLGLVQVAAGLVIGGFGFLCLGVLWNGFAGLSGLSLLAGFPLLVVGGLVASKDPWRNITLTILGLATPVALISGVLFAMLRYNGAVDESRVALDYLVVSALVWIICKVIAYSRGWKVDVGSSTYSGGGRSGGWSSGWSSGSSSSSSSSRSSSFSGGGGRSGGGGSSGSW